MCWFKNCKATARFENNSSVSSDYVNTAFWSQLHVQGAYIVNNPSFNGVFSYSSLVNKTIILDCTWYTWNWKALKTLNDSGKF